MTSVIWLQLERGFLTCLAGERADVNVTLPDVLADLETLLELGVTSRNGKVRNSEQLTFTSQGESGQGSASPTG